AVGPGDSVAALAAALAVHRIDAPAVGQLAAPGRADPGPQDHPILLRIAGGHAMAETNRRLGRCWAGGGHRAQTQQSQRLATVQAHVVPRPHGLTADSLAQETPVPCPVKCSTSRARSSGARRSTCTTPSPR